jgi:hypothetical protein
MIKPDQPQGTEGGYTGHTLATKACYKTCTVLYGVYATTSLSELRSLHIATLGHSEGHTIARPTPHRVGLLFGAWLAATCLQPMKSNRLITCPRMPEAS